MFIYKITNIKNNKSYIGQTRHSVESRWKVHKYDSQRADYPLYRSIRKHGIENFKIEIIEEVNSIEMLDQREIFYIKQFNTILPHGYNCTYGGNRPLISDYTRNKMSKSSMGRNPWNKGIKTGKIEKTVVDKMTLAHQKPVKRIDLKTNEEKIYQSIKETSMDGFKPTHVSGCCKYPFTHKTHKGYRWEYLDKKHIKEFEERLKKPAHKFPKGLVSFNAKEVKVTDLSNKQEFFYKTTTIAAKELGYRHYNTISKYCKLNKIVNNLKFEYLESER